MRHIQRGSAAVLALLFLMVGSAFGQAPSAVERGIDLFEQRKWSEARAVLLPAAEADPGDVRAASYLGRAYRAERNAEQAAHWLEKAVQLEPDEVMHHLYYVDALALKARYAGVIAQARLARKIKSHLDRAVELDPDNVQARMGLIQFYMQAPGIVGGSRKKANEQAEEIRRRDRYAGMRAFGLIYEGDKDWVEAERVYREALTHFPDSSTIRMRLGQVAVQQERYEQAFEAYETLLRSQPQYMPALYHIGRVGALSGDRLDDAEAALRRYLRYKPGRGEPSLAAAHWRLGMVMEKKGDPEAARGEYQAALRLDPKYEEAKTALQKLPK